MSFNRPSRSVETAFQWLLYFQPVDNNQYVVVLKEEFLNRQKNSEIMDNLTDLALYCWHVTNLTCKASMIQTLRKWGRTYMVEPKQIRVVRGVSCS